jgi:glycosyltransferase involved in cell wall biosynthesis
MRVLLVNNHYRQDGGGAETVVFETQALLERAGHEVIPFAMREERTVVTAWSEHFPRRRAMANGNPSPLAYSFRARRSLRDVLEQVRPDVAHVHNPFERLTTSVLDALDAARVPVVMTLHDYKLICPTYRLITEGEICHRCPQSGRDWHAVRHRCMDGSIWRSAVAAVENTINGIRRQRDKVHVFVSPSPFLRDVMTASGLAADRIEVVPNFVTAADRPRRLPADPPRFMFFGRLSPEKGLPVLLDAARLLADGSRIVVYGTGPMEPALRRRVASERLPVELRGHASQREIFEDLVTSTAAVLPAVWYENCPMAILEAAGHAVATIATDLGGMRDIITNDEDGRLVPPKQPAVLAAAMNELAGDPQRAVRLGRRAWERVRRYHTPAAHMEGLARCYERAQVAASA